MVDLSSVLPFVLFCVLIVGAHAAIVDQQSEFNYPNFTSLLPGVGSQIINNTLVLTQANTLNTGSSAWFSSMMQVRGFRTQFTYTITNNSRMLNQRPDGIAFVIQKSSATVNAIGSFGSGIGYGAADGSNAGIFDSVAVEFDSWSNPELNDPTMFHIGVHSNGHNANNASELYRIGDPFQNAQYNLDIQHVIITYDPSLNGGTLTVQFNDQPELQVAGLDIEALASLNPDDGNAYVGFTAGSHNGTNGAYVETVAVTQWSFQFLGQISAANTLVAIANQTTAGEELTLSVQAYDQYNNSMIIDGVGRGEYVLSATLTESDGNVLNGAATYSGVGKYVISFNATKSGTAIVRVFLNNTVVGRGDYSLSVEPAAPYAPFSYPFGFTSGVNTPAIAGVNGYFFVQLQDIFGNNITTDVGTVVATTITPQFDSTYSLQVAGQYAPECPCYSVTYNVTLSGLFTLRVTVNDADTINSTNTLQVQPAAVYPETSVLYGVSETVTAGELLLGYLQLKDVFGNNASNSDATIFLQAAQGHTTVVNGTASCTQGLCQVTFNLTVASYSSEYNIVALIDGRAAQNSQTTIVKVNPAALSPSASYAYGQGISSSIAGEFAFYYVQLTDTFGNNNTYPASVLTTNLTTGSFATTPSNVLVAGGTYTYRYNVTLAANYVLTVLVNGQGISNAQSSVSVAPNVVYPPNCVGFGSGLQEDVVAGDTNLFYVQLRDEFHNNISTNGTEILHVVIENSDLRENASIEFNNGLYEVSYNITRASAYRVIITLDDIPIFNAAENITLLPAPIYPLESVASNVDEGVTAGALNRFQVQLRDVYGNNVTNIANPNGLVTATFVPTSNNGNNVPISVDYSGSGVYILAYNATVTGDYTLTISVNGTTISGGAYTVAVAAAAAFPAFSVTAGSALASSVAGQNSSFFIYLFDVFNNSITNPSPADIPSISIDGQAFVITFERAIAAFVVSYNITSSSSYTLTVSVAQVQIVSSSLQVAPAPLFVANCLAVGSLYGTTAGDKGEIAFYLRDQFGNLIPDEKQVTSLSVTMVLENVKEIPITPTAFGNGSYFFDYNLTTAGYYWTSILINGANISGSPFSTKIGAAPFDPHGTITSGLQTSIFAGELNSFNIILKDIWGNNVTDSSMPNPITPGSISVRFNTISLDIDVTAPNDGAFKVEYNFTKAGVFWMSVTINDTEVGASAPGNVTVSPSSVYPPNCIAQGDGIAEAIVRQTNTFTIIVRDRYGNNRMWSPSPPIIQLTANGLKTMYGQAANQTDGTYLVSYFIEEKAVYSMQVYFFNGAQIQGSPFTLDTNYGNNSPPTVIIVCAVLGSVVVVGGLVGAFIWYRRRRTPYVAILE